MATRDLIPRRLSATPLRPPSGTVARLTDQVDDLYLGPSTAHIVDATTDRKIPHIRLTEGNLVQLGYGINQRRIWTAETDQTSAIAEEIASDKDLTKSLLKSCGVPIPEGELCAAPKLHGKRPRTSDCRGPETLQRKPRTRCVARPAYAG